MHALVIEDELMIAMLIEDQLIDMGYDSITVVDCETAAISAAQLQCPDLIVADNAIAGGSGISAVREICADRIIPVVYSTGYVRPDNADMMLDHGAVLAKPFTFATLRDAVREALEKARQAGHEGPVPTFS